MQRDTHALIPAAAGLIVVDAEWKLIYANPEAKRILTYPKAFRRFELAWTSLQKKFFPALAKQNSSSSWTSQAEFISGRRKYVSRTFPLTKPRDGRPAGTAIAVLLERGGSGSYAVSEVCERFHLTERERVVVEFLIQGLTNKETAGRMNISPNTVRAFIRMVMIKLGVSTRSGIVGIVFRAIHTPLPP
jgi:DNA-binding CsgD family transcriptional regulator